MRWASGMIQPRGLFLWTRRRSRGGVMRPETAQHDKGALERALAQLQKEHIQVPGQMLHLPQAVLACPTSPASCPFFVPVTVPFTRCRNEFPVSGILAWLKGANRRRDQDQPRDGHLSMAGMGRGSSGLRPSISGYCSLGRATVWVGRESPCQPHAPGRSLARASLGLHLQGKWPPEPCSSAQGRAGTATGRPSPPACCSWGCDARGLLCPQLNEAQDASFPQPSCSGGQSADWTPCSQQHLYCNMHGGPGNRPQLGTDHIGNYGAPAQPPGLFGGRRRCLG